MEDCVFKVCNQLISNTHVIGIIIECRNFPNVSPEKMLREKTIDLCVVSKETGNQKTMYMDNGYLINIHWHTQEEFTEIVVQGHCDLAEKTILFDRTGFLKQVFNADSAYEPI